MNGKWGNGIWPSPFLIVPPNPECRTMNSYELRVINPRGRDATVYASSHINDFAAIRRAMSLADEDEVIEVWRGVVCVYSGMPEDALTL
jgi:hypothetical protein